MSAPLTPGVRRALWRIPVILAEDGYATDASLAGELGLDYSEIYTVIAILYRRRRVDRIGGYIVAPAAPAQPLRLPHASGRAA
jgi:hypothetical protein